MKRPPGLALGVIAVILGFIVFEVIAWWPDAPKKRTQEVASEPAPPPPPTAEPAPAPAPPPTLASVAPPRSGRTIPQLHANEGDELRRLVGCSDKKCGESCLVRCDPSQDGRCINGTMAGACNASGECSTTLPAVCPGPGESPP
jgi:hypothetical protein